MSFQRRIGNIGLSFWAKQEILSAIMKISPGTGRQDGVSRLRSFETQHLWCWAGVTKGDPSLSDLKIDFHVWR